MKRPARGRSAGALALVMILALGLGGAWLGGPAWAGDCPQPRPRVPEEVARELNQVREALAAGRLAAARRGLAELAGRAGEGARFHLAFLQGALASAEHKKQEAVREFSRTVELYACDPAAWQNLGAALYAAGRLAPAGRALERAARLSTPPTPDLLHQATLIYLAAGEKTQALALAQELARLPRPEPAWWAALVEAHLALEQYGPAARALDRLLERQPGRAASWRLAAGLAARRKDYARAAAAQAVAYHLEPPPAAGWRQQGELYRAAGLPLAAAAAYGRAFAHPPTPAEQEFLAALYLEGHRLDQAREAAQAAVAAGKNAPRLALLAQVEEAAGEAALARRIYAQAAALADPGGRYSLAAARAAWRQGDLAGAEAAYAQAARRVRPGSAAARETSQALTSLRAYLARAE